MPNNFKLSGDYYVSKAGSDSNNGLTPETPKRTVAAALTLANSGTRTIIVGSGVYRESLVYNNTSVSVTLKADGYCVLEGTNNNSIFVYSIQTSPYFVIDGFEIRGYAYVSGASSGPQYATRLLNCTVKNTDIYTGDFSVAYQHKNSVYVNCNLYFTRGSAVQVLMSDCTFVNCKIGFSSINPAYNALYSFGPTTFFNCSVNNTAIRMGDTTVTGPNFNYNNFYNSFVVMQVASTVTSGVIQDTYGRYYDLSIATSTGDGTVGNPYGRPYTNGAGFGFSAHRTAYPTLNASSSAVDPGFNNVLKQDFSLQSSSFMVGRASDFISNIGGTQVATRVNASGSLFSGSNATVDNLVLSFSDYVISGSAVTGSVTSAPIFVSSSAKVIQEIDYNGLLAFNKDTTAPTGSNQNVPDVLTYTSASGQAGASPDRLTYYMRWTTGSSQPATDAQWENGGLWPAGSFNVFEWNTKPSVDYLGRGNGDQNFNTVNIPTFVKATYIQLRMTLRNDYLI